MNKDIVSLEMLSKIQTLCHNVVDLTSRFEGTHKQQYIRILKMVGHYLHDNRIEPYRIQFDKKSENFSVIIKSAFLNTFEAFRNLMEWEKGTLEFSNIPFLLLPTNSWMLFLEKIEDSAVLEDVGFKIGFNLSGFVQELYMIEGWDSIKTTLRIWSLLGWGSAIQVKKDLSHSLIEYNHSFQLEINEKVYLPVLKGLYMGIVSQSLKLTVKHVETSLKSTDSTKIANLIIVLG
jgi:hypothetical protein